MLDTPEPRQPGRIIYRAEALRQGWSAAEIDRERASGRWAPIRRGAYVDAREAASTNDSERRLALIAATMRDAPPDAVVSHASAAVMHGILLWPSPAPTVQVTRKRDDGGHRRRLLHTRMAPLAPDEITTVGPFQVTSIARTLVDLARALPFETGVIAVDAALHRGLVTRELLVAALAAAARPPGIARARRVVEFADGASESVGESRSRVIFHEAGLPAPTCQLVIRSVTGETVGRSDFGWEEFHLLGEFDGASKYGRLLRPGQSPGDAMYREKLREDALRELGWIVLRWIWSELDDPGRLIARLQYAMELGLRVGSA